MGSVRTRRQVKEETSEVSVPHANGSIHSSSSAAVGAQENIFLFWPNVIGYVRVVLAIGSLYYMPLHPRTCSLLYSVSCLLDAVDGYAARYFEQSTKFGAVLDMVTDRCTTACLLVFLSAAWPRWSIIFQSLISLDFASHYMHMYATLTMGRGESHKIVDEKRSWLLHQYYTKKWVLFTLCAGNELFWIALYLLSFSSPALSPTLLAPPANIKPEADAIPRFLNPTFPSLDWFMQYADTFFPYADSQAVMELARANKIDSFVPWCLFGVSLVPMAIKTGLNVIHMQKASVWLAEGDRAERRAKGLPRKKKA